MDYQTIRQLAKGQQGLGVSDLLALARQNDPFYIGTDSQLAAAKWFRRMWDMLGYTRGVHLRRMHYALVSQRPPVSMPMSRSGDKVEVLRGGTILEVHPSKIQPDDLVWPYVNTERCWGFLNKASKYARYLGLVAPTDIVDRRNPDAKTYTNYSDDPTPRVIVKQAPSSWYDDGTWESQMSDLDEELPTLSYLGELPAWPGFDVKGFDGNRQHHVEIWSEKTTMNDVLEPLCQRHRVDLALAAGEFSITRVIEMLDRVVDAGVPGRIIYISDFDPAGYGMPVSVARKIEFLIANEEKYQGLDVQLEPVMLTGAQVERYSLPRIPVKDSDRRKDHWTGVHGAGATELDALEALYPGEMARIVEAAILQYRDSSLARRSRAARNELEGRLRDLRQDVLDLHAADTGALEDRFSDLRGRYVQLQERFDAAVADVLEEYQAIRNDLTSIRTDGQALAEELVADLQAVYVPLDEYPLPEPELRAPEDVLFDSKRAYLDQMHYYKSRREGFATNGFDEGDE